MVSQACRMSTPISQVIFAFGIAVITAEGCTRTCTAPLVLYEPECVCLAKYERASCLRGDDDSTACQKIIDLGLCNTISYRASCATGCGICVADHVPVTNPQVILRPPKNSVEKLYATDCGDPPPMVNGDVTFSSTLFTSIARHSCVFGYRRQGHGLSKCMRNGWSAHNSHCEELAECGNPPSVVNAGVPSSNGTLEGDAAVYTCSGGYVFVGASNSFCGADGLWTPLGSCVASMCPYESFDLDGAYVLPTDGSGFYTEDYEAIDGGMFIYSSDACIISLKSPDASIARTVTLDFKYFAMESGLWDFVDVYLNNAKYETLDGTLGPFNRTYTTTGDIRLEFIQVDSIGLMEGFAFTYSTLLVCDVSGGYTLSADPPLCYKMVEEYLSRSDADTYCMDEGARLIVVDTPEKFDLMSVLADGVDYRIGGRLVAGQYVWSTGEPITSADVVPYNFGDGECVEFDFIGVSPYFRAYTCSPTQRFICEYVGY